MNNSDRINAEVTRCLALAEEHFGRSFARPTVNYALRGTSGGTACYSTWTVSLNGGLLCDNADTVIGQTLPHEIAHLIDYATRTHRGRPHGPAWAAIMRLFGKPAKRCHAMDTTLTQTRVRRLHSYSCVCGKDHTLGPKHHKRVQACAAFEGTVRSGVRWKSCGNAVIAARYVGLSPETQRVLLARQESKR